MSLSMKIAIGMESSTAFVVRTHNMVQGRKMEWTSPTENKDGFDKKFVAVLSRIGVLLTPMTTEERRNGKVHSVVYSQTKEKKCKHSHWKLQWHVLL